ncbi:MAG: Nif3-like dinuclear metal center hexameric protein [Ignavibacteriales bacterium]|nr:Nif3-like dinuclear metal center hexameric protein [Ignavibacteriales bacterium]
MTIADIEQFFELWAPKWTAWERDNVGLQIGDSSRKVKSVLIALDVTPDLIAEAIAKKVDLIISHHPLLFQPPSSITTKDEVGTMILRLAEKRIALYSAHTNLDFTRDGVSFVLAKTLGLNDVRFLSPLKGTLVKIVVFAPQEYVDKISHAMANADAGVIGEYTSCSFQTKGTGTFRGSKNAKPFLGAKEKLETINEVRLEMVAPKARAQAIANAMKAAHPYEEAAYDIYPLENTNPNFGMGAIGSLKTRISLGLFLTSVKKALHAEGLRYTGNLSRQIQRVAVCGGSGSDLLSDAIKAKADVLVTADVRYHTFHSAENTIALVDAGHWETEHIILEPIAARLREAAKQSGDALKIVITKNSTNPIHFL